MDKVASLSSQDRSDLFRDVADEMGLAPAIVEKDFWVCWTLKHLFGHPILGKELMFKGGTTLSKVYDVIKRFSEDIDISISRSLLGFEGERDPSNPELGKKKRERLLDDMTETCSEFVRNAMKRELEVIFNSIIGEHASSWEIAVDVEDPDKQTLLFWYPSVEDRLDYIPSCVRIECGCRSDFWPVEKKIITPYSAKYFPNVFEDSDCPVTVLTVMRTFWEKATILHQEYHRPEDKRLPSRYSRHYYDLGMLARSKYKSTALKDQDLLRGVVEHKKCFFRCGWAKYDEAVPGSLRLVPKEFRVNDLRRDYRSMEPMFFGTIPLFDDIIEELSKLEGEINT